MEPFRFADILMILLISVVTCGILMLVKRKRQASKSKTQSDETDKIQTTDEDN
ncbi:MAG TPA: hypothetical protein VJ974_02125 [Geopsychrobacteraceae bacterium]|nr:hypothetical protein [Geopsychrobacteraceae bacterium]